jgi:hypothetical protein
MLKHSVALKFNNVEMLKTLWKMLKTPAAGICSLCQNFLQKTLTKRTEIYTIQKRGKSYANT